jgi:hypothetical protein
MLIQINAAGPIKATPFLFPEDFGVIIAAVGAIQSRGDAANILIGDKKTADCPKSGQNVVWGRNWALTRPIRRVIHRLSRRPGGRALVTCGALTRALPLPRELEAPSAVAAQNR